MRREKGLIAFRFWKWAVFIINQEHARKLLDSIGGYACETNNDNKEQM